MKKRTCLFLIQQQLILGASIVLFLAGACSNVWAYRYYSDPPDGTGGCLTCHGDFRGAVSPKGTTFVAGNKHDMHRNGTYMGTTCNLCHTGGSSERFPVFIKSSNGTANNQGLGCTGCHEPLGLRKHHLVNGITECQGCHQNDGTPPPEGTNPPYYGTPDTKARNAGNPVLAHYTNENWSGSDLLGLDNDGDNHYDLADYDVGPYRILSVTPQGNDMEVKWLTAGGRTNTVQGAANLSTPFSDISSAIEIPGVGLKTNSFTDVGGAANTMRFYRMKAVVP